MNKAVVAFSAIFEGLVGLALIVAPVLSVQMLFHEAISGAAIALARIAGFCYVSLGAACLPFPTVTLPALRGLLIYNVLAGIFVGYLLMAKQQNGKLLLPAFLLHVVISVLLAWIWLRRDSINPS